MSSDTKSAPQTHAFQAEVAELLRLMVHSVYSETRHLPARADLQRVGCLRQAALRGDRRARRCMATTGRLAIRITPDKDAGTLTVADNGIGMDARS